MEKLLHSRWVIRQLAHHAVHVSGTRGARQFGLHFVAGRVRYEMQCHAVSLESCSTPSHELYRIVSIVQGHPIRDAVFLPSGCAAGEFAHAPTFVCAARSGAGGIKRSSAWVNSGSGALATIPPSSRSLDRPSSQASLNARNVFDCPVSRWMQPS